MSDNYTVYMFALHKPKDAAIHRVCCRLGCHSPAPLCTPRFQCCRCGRAMLGTGLERVWGTLRRVARVLRERVL